MRFPTVLSVAAIVCLSACAEEQPPLQPAPPADRNFTATVNDQPVVGGTAGFQCLIRPHEGGGSQLMLTFNDDVGHTIQVGLRLGELRPGPRDIVFGMATAEGRAYGRPQDASAEITWIEATATGAAVSGKFSLRLDQVNSAPGIADQTPLDIREALFEQVDCVDPAKMRLPKPGA
jgi:hypothetical protein